jgi:hypothetical protein
MSYAGKATETSIVATTSVIISSSKPKPRDLFMVFYPRLVIIDHINLPTSDIDVTREYRCVPADVR